MNEMAWYEVVRPETPLTQGDLIFNCPLLTWGSVDKSEIPDKSDHLSLQQLVTAFQEDVIVMT